MQPLDRDIAQARRDAAAMLAATLRQRTERRRHSSSEHRRCDRDEAGVAETRAVHGARRRGARRASDGRPTWSLG